MLHFSCDLCGRQLGERRYVVKMEGHPSFDPEDFDEEDLDADHLQEISEMLQEMEATGNYQLDDCSPKEFRFDLCSKCYRKFVKDPLARDANRRLNFSEN
jgi:hypothetical protein